MFPRVYVMLYVCMCILGLNTKIIDGLETCCGFSIITLSFVNSRGSTLSTID